MQQFTMSDATPDSESLMALHVLLKIRSDSINEAEQFCVSRSANDTVSVRPTAQDSVATQRSNDKRKDQALAPKQTTFRPSPILNAHPVPPSPSFVPMVRPPPLALALAPSLSLNLSVQNSANLPPVPFYPMATDPIKPMATPSSSLQASDQRKRKKESTKEASAAAKAIRTAEIEAALRSKPQRGRKRDNLSVLERQELTRTRNREHAKSTRVRKKARYQELLDNEQKYEEMNQIQELHMQRQECVDCFLSIRESMLRSCLAEHEPSTKSTSGGEPQGEHVQQRFVSPSHRVVTFLESYPSFRDGSRFSRSAQRSEKSLSELVSSNGDFEFKVVGSTTLDASSVGSDQGASGPLATFAMTMFDRNLAIKVEETMGRSFVGNLSYTLVDGGVAVNESGTGFARVLVTTHMGQQTLMTGILKIQFVPDSAKLRSIVWYITEEGSDEHAHAQDAASESSNESLGCQTSYPSVVSLDPGGDLSGEKLRAADVMDGPGPGMHI